MRNTNDDTNDVTIRVDKFGLTNEGDTNEENNINEEENEELNYEEKEFEEKIKNEKYFEIKKMLKESETPIKIWQYRTLDNDNSTILHSSVIHNCTKITKEIIRYCKNNLSKDDLHKFINKKNNKGITALHYAAFKGNIDIIHLLIFYGADLNAVTNKSLDVLNFACQGNKPNSLVYFNYYYESKMNFEKLDSKYSTPLHWACYMGSYECVEFLLNKNVKIEPKDEDGNTPLHLAIISGIAKIVRLLLQKGAKPNIENYKGETPIQVAQKKKRLEIYNILKSSSKCAVCNCKAPAKKIEKSKKYIIYGIIFKILTSFILLCNIYPFLFNETCYEYINLIFLAFFLIINIVFIILYNYLICSEPGYIKDDEKITDIENLLFKQKDDFKNFCFKCSVYKTDTLKHCVICEKCCHEFDHHCYWLNNDIGKNNYISFIVILYICLIDFISMILVSVYSLFISYEFLFTKDKNDLSENILDTIYKYVGQYLSYIEINYNFIPKNPFIEYLQISIIILIVINIFVLIPLIYLIFLHTSNCKKKTKEKTSIRKIDMKIQNINPDELLATNSENDTSLDS